MLSYVFGVFKSPVAAKRISRHCNGVQKDTLNPICLKTSISEEKIMLGGYSVQSPIKCRAS